LILNEKEIKVTMGVLLEVKGVSQTVRDGFWMKSKRILRDVNLRISEGAICGFLGANGAGKTTLVQLITGLKRPSEGSVTLNRIDAHTRAARSQIGYLPERPYFHEHLTGQNLLAYLGALSGMSGSEIRSQTRKVLSMVGLSDAKDLELKYYSKGMLQRIGIAQAIFHDPALVVLDEPMSGLDPSGRKEVKDLILQLSREGRTVLFSSHVIPDVESICSQVALIVKGEIRQSGLINELMKQELLETEISFILKQGNEEYRSWGEFRSIHEFSGVVQGIVTGHDSLMGALAKLLSVQAQVISVIPLRPSLEQLLDKKYEQAKYDRT
jgi:ABC-2 type transport system ATP-binding protein